MKLLALVCADCSNMFMILLLLYYYNILIEASFLPLVLMNDTWCRFITSLLKLSFFSIFAFYHFLELNSKWTHVAFFYWTLFFFYYKFCLFPTVFHTSLSSLSSLDIGPLLPGACQFFSRPLRRYNSQTLLSSVPQGRLARNVNRNLHCRWKPVKAASLSTHLFVIITLTCPNEVARTVTTLAWHAVRLSMRGVCLSHFHREPPFIGNHWGAPLFFQWPRHLNTCYKFECGWSAWLDRLLRPEGNSAGH